MQKLELDKRCFPKMVSMNFKVKDAIRHNLKALAKIESKSMNLIVNELLENWIEKKAEKIRKAA